MSRLTQMIAEGVRASANTLRALSGSDVVPIYSITFLILFAAQVWGVIDWPWWAVFAPLIAAPLIQVLWWAALMLAELVTRILQLPLVALLRWANKDRRR